MALEGNQKTKMLPWGAIFPGLLHLKSVLSMWKIFLRSSLGDVWNLFQMEWPNIHKKSMRLKYIMLMYMGKIINREAKFEEALCRWSCIRVLSKLLRAVTNFRSSAAALQLQTSCCASFCKFVGLPLLPYTLHISVFLIIGKNICLK